MFRKFLVLFLAAVLFLATGSPAQAVVDPRAAANNIYGIHIIDENDLEDAARLVNSSGGKWGYVTVVIREEDRNTAKWQRTFDRMRKLKLIPLIRLATRSTNGSWEKPEAKDADAWVSFLSSLNWVTKNRYVILFNEPNHDAEWGGAANPKEYAQVARAFAEKLKADSPDYFVLPAGFDAAAPSGATTIDEALYLRDMYRSDPAIFTLFDGWTSHSYPNPGFAGKVTDTGKRSIQGYKWELATLARFKGNPALPVFITETGWLKSESTASHELAAQNLTAAFQSVWTDPQIVAVTPFLLNYTTAPFKGFSWKKPGQNGFYPEYERIRALPKVAGEPEQIERGEFVLDFPGELVTNSEYQLFLKFKNLGQTIWDSNEDYNLRVETNLSEREVWVGKIEEAAPGEESEVRIVFETPKLAGEKHFKAILEKQGREIVASENLKVTLVPPPSLRVSVRPWYKEKINESFSVTLADERGPQVEIKNIIVKDGEGFVPELRNVIPDRVYTFILQKPFYLTKERVSYLYKGKTAVDFGRLLPVDTDGNGEFTASDFLNYFKNPFGVIYSVLIYNF